MARFDFNKDGKKDIFDSMIEYEIYKDVMGEDDNKPPQHNSSKDDDSLPVGCFVYIGVVVLALIFALFGALPLFEGLLVLGFVLYIFFTGHINNYLHFTNN